MARAFDENGLREFVTAGEKLPPPEFVGREGVIADILAAAGRAWRPGKERHGEPGMTRIIQGAPGAGKSSVLAEIESRCQNAPVRPGAPRALILNSVNLSNIPAVLQRLAKAVNPAEAVSLFREERRGVRLDIAARPPRASAAGQAGTGVKKNRRRKRRWTRSPAGWPAGTARMTCEMEYGIFR